MSNCMKFQFAFYLKHDTELINLEALNVLMNGYKENTSLPDVEFFTGEDWKNLFCRFNGYPDFKTILDSQYFVEVDVETREDKKNLLEAFFEWITPHIDLLKLSDGKIGTFTCDSSFDSFIMQIEDAKLKFNRGEYGKN